MAAPNRALRTVPQLTARVTELQELLDHATAFTFDVDLSSVDAAGTEVVLASISRLHALHVVRGPTSAWSVRYGLGPLHWSVAAADWTTGFVSIGSLERALAVRERLAEMHQRRVEKVAGLLVMEARARVEAVARAAAHLN